MVVILLIATLISIILGQALEGIAIAAIVLLAVALGFAQEYRAERVIEALRHLTAPLSRVVRDGQDIEVPASELVPGDIIRLQAGDRVPADGRLVEAVNLHTDESSLTGESVPVDKQSEPLSQTVSSAGDKTNMVFAGTAATYGRGRAVVTATGMTTEFGQIAAMLQTVERGRTPLQANLDRVGHTLAKAALGIVAVIVGVGLLRGQPILEMLVFGIALAVAVVPEALPAVVTISLAIGVQRMARRRALVRRLPAVETLGSTKVICSDKTGTLTKDEMTIRRVWTADGAFDVTGSGYDPSGSFIKDGEPHAPSPALLELLRGAALASDARLVQRDDQQWHILGEPTEGALVVAAAKAGLQKDELDEQHPRIDEVPFTSESKRMTTLHRVPDGQVAYAKGAPEVILEACTHILAGPSDEPTPIDEHRPVVLEMAARMADSALRVLAVATKRGVSGRDSAQTEMTLLGLVGMLDPPRPEAKAAVAKTREAGVRVVMITGDHPNTAAAVARELDLPDGRTVTGAELAALSDEQLRDEVSGIAVFAASRRVTSFGSSAPCSAMATSPP